MIPYFQLLSFDLGPIPIQVWGLMVALGILAATWVAAKMAKTRGQDPQVIWDLSARVIIAAFIGARLIHAVYEPATYLQDPLEFFRIWHGGFSIMGGFLGALPAGIWFLRKKYVDVYAYADTAVFGLPLGIFIGRIGCFLIHDHPGTLTDFALGVKYPDGVRHDLGLYDSINGLILFLLFLWLAHRKMKTGTFVVVFLLWYGVVRFFSDFLRATNGPIVDTRYFNLTPAQYLAVVMVVGGVWMWRRKLPTEV
ncbi:prolipoprotein diacylglyceryl transferase [Candidatus Uhrbacteria bacterium]|nr:prolipoprotein diacylglyceryl transferase [Candidatus Uhrbacteria bacterium]